ncbi:MAG: hypothetical protein QNI91_01830 [Arenicellales bacterium]|nr:hypothetical protein [Arenicellales bacterium]
MASDLFSQYFRLISVTAFASLILSAWSVWADPIVNNDGVYYFRAAEQILYGDWDEAISVYSWPFYPALIAYLSKFTGVEIVSAAYVLNALLCVVVVTGFLAVVFELGGDRNTLITAAIVILAFPTLNKFRPFIIRDIGYLAFYLWSIGFLFRYWKTRQIRSFILWFLLAAIAALFRVEGVAMLVAVPIVVYSMARTSSGNRWWMAALYVVGGCLLLLVLTLWLHRDFALFSPSGDIQNPSEIWGRISHYLDEAVGNKLDLLKEHFAGRYYLIAYVLIIVFVTLAEVVRRLAVVYALLAVWGLRRNILFPDERLKSLWLALILINIVILIGSAIFTSIVVDRYALTTTVTILLATPFVLTYLWRKWSDNELGAGMKWVFSGVVAIGILVGVKSLDVFTDKQYLYEAGQWLAENTPEDSTLHSNNLILIYYSGKDAFHKHDNYAWKYTHSVVKRKKWKEYDYLAIQLSRKDYPWVEWLNIHLHGTPIKRFFNDRGDSVVIYENNS